MTGVFNLRPKNTKYVETWDVAVLLRYLKTLTPVSSLTLKMLCCKLVTLVVLTQASRSHSVSLLTLDGMKQEDSFYVLYYSGLLKQCRKGKANPYIMLKKYDLDSSICVYRTLEEYLSRTKTLRGRNRHLFISYIKPHNPVGPTTIARWVKFLMEKAGIDVNKFKTHSVRSAATSKAKQSGIPLTDILKVAGWSNERTFAQYYDKPIEVTEDFQSAVLH